MSKQIDLTQPLSAEDVQYLTDRCNYAALAENAANLGGSPFDENGVYIAGPLDDDPAAGDTPPAVADGVSTDDGSAAAPFDDSAAVSGDGDAAGSTE